MKARTNPKKKRKSIEKKRKEKKRNLWVVSANPKVGNDAWLAHAHPGLLFFLFTFLQKANRFAKKSRRDSLYGKYVAIFVGQRNSCSGNCRHRCTATRYAMRIGNGTDEKLSGLARHSKRSYDPCTLCATC